MTDIVLDGLSYDRGFFSGTGFIAGQVPFGLVTVSGEPAGRTVEIRHRLTRTVVAVTFSATDGTYMVPNLNAAETYDVIGRDWSGMYNDVIVSRLTPKVS